MAYEPLTLLKGNPLELGTTKTDKGYNFAFCSREESITLLLFKHGSENAEYSIVLDDRYRVGSVFSVELCGIDFREYEYIYKVGEEYVTDPYTKYVTNGSDFGEDNTEKPLRSGIVTEAFDWEEDRPLCISYSDMIMYKLHIRGFTKHTSSRVPDKGTFSALKAKIPYLKELGVNALVIMPPFEFFEYPRNKVSTLYSNSEVKKLNYWGYTKGLYFAPKYAYSKNAKSIDYTGEFKSLVKELHKNGIEVIIELFFGDEATSSLVCDCVKHWVIEYHVDGINLCCRTDAYTGLASDPLLSRTKLFANYWNDSSSGYRTVKNLANYNEGFMINARRFLKGDEDMLRTFMQCCRTNPSNAANINFITNHNGFTLNDLVSYDRKHNEANGENNADGADYNYSWNCGIEGVTRKKKVLALRIGQAKNAVLMLMLAQGTPLMMAGDEFLNSQDGNNNPYCLDNEVTWLNWKKLDTNREMFEFVKTAIAFRKEHRILHMPDELRGLDYMSVGFPDVSYHSENAWYAPMENYNRHIGVLYCGKYAKNDELIYVAYNMHWEAHELALPKLSKNTVWEIAINTKPDETEAVDNDGRKVHVNPRSVVVLTAKP